MGVVLGKYCAVRRAVILSVHSKVILQHRGADGRPTLPTVEILN